VVRATLTRGKERPTRLGVRSPTNEARQLILRRSTRSFSPWHRILMLNMSSWAPIARLGRPVTR